MITMIRAYDHVGDWLVRNLGDFVNHALGFYDIALAICNQDAFLCDHEHANGCELLFARWTQLLV